jgi:hypothetical protein
VGHPPLQNIQRLCRARDRERQSIPPSGRRLLAPKTLLESLARAWNGRDGAEADRAREQTKAESAAMFFLDEEAAVFGMVIADGGKLPPTIPVSSGIATHCATRKEPLIVSNAYTDPRFNRNTDLVSVVLMDTICVRPILSSDDTLIGLLEIVNKVDGAGSFNDHDIQTTQAIAMFIALAFANPKLRSLSSTASGGAEIEKYIPEAERGETEVPLKLVLSSEKQREASSLAFSALDWDGMQIFKLFFFIFTKFHLLETFHISSELFFNYLFQLRSKYMNVPYHNWTHIADVIQFLAYVLGSIELFALFVSATAHDIGHNGFVDLHNVKADLPLSILFKTQSLEETTHCQSAAFTPW